MCRCGSLAFCWHMEAPKNSRRFREIYRVMQNGVKNRMIGRSAARSSYRGERYGGNAVSYRDYRGTIRGIAYTVQ